MDLVIDLVRGEDFKGSGQQVERQEVRLLIILLLRRSDDSAGVFCWSSNWNWVLGLATCPTPKKTTVLATDITDRHLGSLSANFASLAA